MSRLGPLPAPREHRLFVARFLRRRAIRRVLACSITIPALLVSGLGPNPSFAQSFSVGVRIDYPVGQHPRAIAVGDLNGDNRPDIVATEQGSNFISILLAASSGGFGAETRVTVGNTPVSVAMGDLNGDSKLDLVVGNYSSNSVSVLLGNGDGTFTSKPDLTALSGPSAVLGDLNRDGKLDLVSVNSGSNNVSVFFGLGDGTFSAKTDYATGASPNSVAIGDLDGDAVPDLIVTNNGSATISVLLGNDSGTFPTRHDFSVGSGAYGLAVSDLNGNCVPDVAVANYTGNNVSVLLDYDPTSAAFASRTDFPTGNNPSVVAIGDLNGDGKPDIVTPNDGSYTVSVLLNDGAAGFTNRTDIATGRRPLGMAIADVNADGRRDLVVGAYDDLLISIFLNGTGGFAPKTAFAAGDHPYSAAIGDLDGDGKQDLAVADNFSNRVSVLIGNGAGAFGPGTEFVTGDAPASVAIGDLSADGRPDLALADYNIHRVSVLLASGAPGNFGPKTDYVANYNPISVAIGDLNGDGRPDLAVASPFNDIVLVYLASGTPGSFATGVGYSSGNDPRSVAIGDLNGDGRPDLVLPNFSSNQVSVLLGSSTPGTFPSRFAYNTTFGPISAAIGDLNGDGRPDLAVADYTAGKISILLASGSPGTFGAKTDYVVGTNPTSIALRDVNGDGKLDAVAANLNSNTVSIMLGNGAGALGARNDFATGANPRSVAVGDVNGDGSLDLVTADNGANTISVLLGLERTTTTLTASPNPCSLGGVLDLTAAVSASPPGGASPSGTIRFFDGTTLLGAASLIHGVASLSVYAPRLGTRSLAAEYGGDTKFFGSISPAIAENVVSGSGTKNFVPIQDNTLYEDDGGEKSNGSAIYFVAGRNNSSSNGTCVRPPGMGRRRGLVQFRFNGLDGIPANATITSVALTMQNYTDSHNTLGGTIELHRMLAAWGEGSSNSNTCWGKGIAPTLNDATWFHRKYDPSAPGGGSNQWTQGGAEGDYVASVSVSAQVNPNQTAVWSQNVNDANHGMVTDLQNWVNGTWSNYGWLVKGNEANPKTTRRFYSRESGLGPTLQVTYTTPDGAAVGSCCLPSGCSPNMTPDACKAAGGTYNGNGSTCPQPPAPDPCATGSCCLPDYTCRSGVTSAQCGLLGGTYNGNGSTCSGNPCPLEPYVDALPPLPVAVPTSGTSGSTATYDMRMMEFDQKLHRDLPLTRVWGFAGTYPGPTIEASTGNPVTVNWINDLRDANGQLRTTHYLPVDHCLVHNMPDAMAARTVIHLHGGHVPPNVDGFPLATAKPGDPPTTYVYPNNQPAATLWYHDHAMGITRLNVMMGLAGLYVVRDPVENALGLPSGNFEIPLVIQDRSFNQDGTLSYGMPPNPAMWMEHFFGKYILVNGKVWPYRNVTPGKYRFRILNGSNSRVYTLALWKRDDAVPPSSRQRLPFWVIGNEGGLLPKPVKRDALTITPGERIDVVIDFQGYQDAEILLENSAAAVIPVTPVMKFVVQSGAAYTGALPSVLNGSFSRMAASSAVRTRTLTLGPVNNGPSDPCPTGFKWMIDGRPFEDITENPLLNTTEIWGFVNGSSDIHPMHLHLVQFQVLDRRKISETNGPWVVPDSSEMGWKDTARASPDSVTRVIARFTDYTGDYPYHCHILEHEDNAMMRQYEVSPPVTFSAATPPGCSYCHAVAAAWGDFDGDGDLDLVVAGYTLPNNALATTLFRNDGGTFVDVGGGLPGVDPASLAWGDYDNDGDLDLLIAGRDTGGVPISRIYRNTGGVFADIGAGLTGVYSSPPTTSHYAAWGDYDNDGDLDLVISGTDGASNPVTLLYRNDGGSFVAVAAGLQGMKSSAVAWGDYDNDGDLDLAISGLNAGSAPTTALYRNDGGAFTPIAAGFTGLFGGSLAWADYDNDGDLDLAMNGFAASGKASIVYRNDSGVFVDLGAGLPGMSSGSVAWGDYDGDGDPDLVLTGSGASGSDPLIFRNDFGVFEPINAGLSFTGTGASAAWGDFDNDGRLDLLLTGGAGTMLYRNNDAPANTAPSAPTNLAATRVALDAKWDGTSSHRTQAGVKVRFAWTAATDSRTPATGLSYNLRIGTTPGGNEVVTAMANTNGYLKVPQIGNAQKQTSSTVQLAAGVYYWSVQAIDASYAGSPFASEHSYDTNTGLDAGHEPPLRFALHDGVPNPFSRTTSFAYDLPRSERVRLEVFDLGGRRVRVLVSRPLASGRYQVTWDGRDDAGRRVGAGIYLTSIRAGSFESTRRTVVLP
jgi:FtsP/CotA-like multicopper oxidase with cupredoxin domain